MRYVTAQRVRSTDGEVGINGFLYSLDPGVDPNREFDNLVAHPPGTADVELIAVEPGGNYVASYLDVLVEVDVTTDSLASDFEEFASELPDSLTPSHHERRGRSWESDEVRVRFNWSTRIPGPPTREFEALAERISELLVRWEEPGHRTSDQPLEIRAEKRPDELVLTLEQTSARRLRRATGTDEMIGSITIDYNKLRAFEQLHGTFLPHAVDLLLPAQLDTVAHGGVRIVDVHTGRILWQSADTASRS